MEVKYKNYMVIHTKNDKFVFNLDVVYYEVRNRTIFVNEFFKTDLGINSERIRAIINFDVLKYVEFFYEDQDAN